MKLKCEIITHDPVGDETITVNNPDYVPAIPAWTETVLNPDYVPATEGYYETVENPDYIPATEPSTVLEGYMKWNWTGGPIKYTPAAPGGTDDWGWHQVGMTGDSKAGTPGVVHKGNGKASFFYYESVYKEIPGQPAQGEPTIEVWVEGTPAQGEEYIKIQHEEVPAIGEEFIVVPNPDFEEAWEEQVCVEEPALPTPPVTESSVAPGQVVQVVETVEEIKLTSEATTTAVAPVPAPSLATTGVDVALPAALGVALVVAGVSALMKRVRAGEVK